MKKTSEDQIIIYKSEDGAISVDVHFEDDTAWLTQDQMASLFQTDRTSITKHIKNIFETKELDQTITSAKFAQHLPDGRTYQVTHYNLDLIISVGYRVNSIRGTQFRIWATQRLKEYIIKGFTLDDERLKQGGDKAIYFDELLERIREIRASERNFYQKVTDIYTTSIDYNKDEKITQEFFATVQNKMHYAVHGHTAAEIIAMRADSKKPHMGLTSFKGSRVYASDTLIAKNYLSEPEIKQLNLIVSLYLDFAELQATNKRSMKMADWISKLDEFLRLSEKQILIGPGKVSAKKAEEVAGKQYDLYRKAEDKNYISDFDKMAKKLLKKGKTRKNF